jgi:uncharacterized membrane protein YjdF
MISLFIFSIAYMVKGGWLGKIRSIHDLRDKNKIADRLLDGKLLGVLLVFLFVFFDKADFLDALIYTVAWILAAHPSMGEEAGAIGRTDKWWGDYKDAVYPAGHYKQGQNVFDRRYGILKGVQRGAWIGAVFTCAGATTLSIPIMGLGFVAAHFIGQELYFRIHKQGQSWAYAEPIIGSLLGVCYIL